MLDKTGGISLTLSYLALMMTSQVLERILPQPADLLDEDFLLVNGKSMVAFNFHRHYLSAILTAATKEDLESESLSLLSLKIFAFFKEHSTPASN
jgi:hypothetical protein